MGGRPPVEGLRDGVGDMVGGNVGGFPEINIQEGWVVVLWISCGCWSSLFCRSWRSVSPVQNFSDAKLHLLYRLGISVVNTYERHYNPVSSRVDVKTDVQTGVFFRNTQAPKGNTI